MASCFFLTSLRLNAREMQFLDWSCGTFDDPELLAMGVAQLLRWPLVYVHITGLGSGTSPCRPMKGPCYAVSRKPLRLLIALLAVRSLSGAVWTSPLFRHLCYFARSVPGFLSLPYFWCSFCWFVLISVRGSGRSVRFSSSRLSPSGQCPGWGC